MPWRNQQIRVYAVKTEYMCLYQRGDISTVNGCSLKLVDKFTYLGSSVSSTENDIKRDRSAIDRWKSDLSDKIKHNFSQAAVVSILLYGCTTWTLTRAWRKSLSAIAQEYYEIYGTNPGSSIL